MSAKHFYMQFNVGDWLKDPAVSSCSAAARGVWVDLLCAMHEAGRSGILSKPKAILARLGRCTAAELDHALTELQATGAADVTIRNGNVTITNRRMKREFETREAARLRKRKSRSKSARCADVTTTLEIETELEIDTDSKNPSTRRKPSRGSGGSGVLIDVSSETLRSPPQLRAWFDQESKRHDGWVKGSEAEWANAAAAAAKAVSGDDVASEVGLFKWLVKNRRWDMLTATHDDIAKAMKRRTKSARLPTVAAELSATVKTPPAEPTEAQRRAALRSILAAEGRSHG